jgi:lipoate---protein ligase
MQFLDLTLPTPEENLALDEALLEEAECDGRGELLRLWEPDATAVVLGRSSAIEAEVHVHACREQGIPILRRVSGGATVLIGRGCLLYSLVLSRRLRPALQAIDRVHAHVLERFAEAFGRHAPGVERRGTSDLALAGRKFSGNSVRFKREHVLYHGTLLHDFPLREVARFLRSPPRQPAYRDGRVHEEFLVNLPLPVDTIRQTLRAAWYGNEPRDNWPQTRTARLVLEKYAKASWNQRGDD